MREPVWLTEELIMAVHERQLAEHGGSSGVRDRGLLQSAIARPKNLWAYAGEGGELPGLAAAYGFGIARNHPFIDGNKRTAAVACETFLALNGYVLTPTDAELYPVYMALAAGELDEAQFARWLRDHARPEQASEPGMGYTAGR